MMMRERWVLLKIPRCDIDGVGERRWFVLERPRRDTNGGSETEVTVTSKLEREGAKLPGG